MARRHVSGLQWEKQYHQMKFLVDDTMEITMSNKLQAEDKRNQLRKAALEYHEFPTPGKIAIAPTKQLVNQHDLALAYSPGVAAPCEEIVKDPAAAFKYTSRGNLVGVVTNGTAVLGLGDIGQIGRAHV